jgi:hypothetical protein
MNGSTPQRQRYPPRPDSEYPALEKMKPHRVTYRKLDFKKYDAGK